MAENKINPNIDINKYISKNDIHKIREIIARKIASDIVKDAIKNVFDNK